MRTFYKSLLFCLLLAGPGCTDQLFLKVNQAPVVQLKATENQILLLPLPDASWVNKREQKAALYAEALQQAKAGAQEGLSKGNTFKIVQADSATREFVQRGAASLSPEMVKTLCRQQQASHVLVINKLSADIQKDGILAKDQYTEFMGWGNPAYARQIMVLVTAQWLLLDQEGHLVDSAFVSGRTPYVYTQEHKVNMPLVNPSLLQSGASLNAAARISGLNYAQRLFRKDIVINRPYYRMGEFAPAAEWIEIRNWQEASALLLPLASNESPTLRAKAAYNLALMCEAQGKTEEAKIWAQQSAQEGNGLARKMLRDLK